MIGVCIKYYNENYGGMLQAYATTQLLAKMGLDYELIRYKKKITLLGVFKSIPRCFNGVLQHEKKDLIQKKLSKVLHTNFKKNDDIRMKAFHEFSNNNFKKGARAIAKKQPNVVEQLLLLESDMNYYEKRGQSK